MTTQETPPAKARAGKERSKERVKVPPPAGSIADLYAEVLPAVDFEAEQTKGDVALTVPAAQLRNVLATSRHHPKLQMDLLRNQTAVDWLERGLEVVYHLYSTTLRHNVAIKTWVPAENPALPTVTDIWRMADWAERECREMFGIEFLGHPDPRNLLLDEDLDIHPLRKSHPLAPIAIEQGVDVEYFTKTRPREAPTPPPAVKAAEAPADGERAQRIAEAKKRAEAVAGVEAKPAAELTPEERAAKQAAQAERITKARELAAARRSEGPPVARAPRPQAETTTAEVSAAAPAATPAPATPATPKPAAPKPAAAKAPAGDLSPEEAAAKKAAQEERVRKARELAAQRRAQKEGS